MKTAAAGAAGIAATGMVAGCAPKTVATEAVAAPVASAPVAAAEAATLLANLIPQAYLNPQDYDYRQNTTDFKTLFSPLKIGPLSLNHRMVKSAAGSATYLAGLTDELLQLLC